MKFRWLTALCLPILLASCSKTGPPPEDAVSTSPGVPAIYVVNCPLQYFAERIGGERVNAVFPAPAGEDPAYWKPGPGEVAQYQGADIILLNGASYAKWVDKVSLPHAKMVDTSAGIRDRFVLLEEEVTHAHGPEGKHAHGGVAFTTWLDPRLAVEQARAILNALSERWPEHRSEFEASFAGLEQDLAALDAAFEKTVAAAPDTPLVFSHPVYQYLERRYRLNGRSVHWEPDELPGEAMWAEMKELLGVHPARWMVWEGDPMPEVAKKLEELGVRSIVFDPCANVPEVGDFLTVMRSNTEALGEVFAPQEVRRRSTVNEN